MSLADQWNLDPEVVFLNHGSFGAAPRAVLERQRELRDQMEAEPVRFFLREAPQLLDTARRVLADFVGADVAGLVMVPNATTAVNAVLRSLPLAPGDEILSTGHGYPACRAAAVEIAAAAGARAVEAPLPTRVDSPEQVVERVVAAMGDRTRVLVIDTITSPTALVLPVAPIVAEARSRAIPVLVDGAHAPGMVALDVAGLGADFYTGNCHKWLCAPKGAAFLWVAPAWRDRIRPVVLSHAAGLPPGPARYLEEFGWTGTSDPTAACCVPAAIEAMAAMVSGGWPEIRRRNHDLVLRGLESLATVDGVAPVGPPEMLGSMAAVTLPPSVDGDRPVTFGWDPLQGRLYDEFRIEVPVTVFPAWPQRLLRISAQLYNRPDQYAALAEALSRLLP